MKTVFTTMRPKVFVLSLILFFAGWANIPKVQAQGIDALNVVWDATYEEGKIFNIKPNAGGTYTACGWGLKYVGDKPPKREGLIIEFDESGNELQRAFVKIPQSYIDSHTGDHYDFWFTTAFKTDDGGFIAFGCLFNPDADLSEKEPDWDEIGEINESYYLTNGAWIVRLNSDLEVVSNKLVRGALFSDGYRTADGNIVMAGLDATGKGWEGNANEDSITMLRKYDQNGALLIDKRDTLREIRAIYQYPDGNFVAITPDKILNIDGSSMNITPTELDQIPGLSSVPNFGAIGLSPTEDGGVFFTAHMYADPDPVTQYNNGVGTYKLTQSNNLHYKKENTPSDTIFYPPLKLPDEDLPVKYVGTAAIREVVGPKVETVENLIYELTDNGAFTYRVGMPYPEGTALKTVSQVDGFFSCGMDEDSGLAVIAKLSTCANFKLKATGDPIENHPFVDGLSVVLQERTIEYEGEQGNVTYNWTLTDVTLGGPATDVSTTITGTPNTPVIPAKTVTFKTGKTFALLRYTITAKDDYLENGKRKICQQTKTILIRLNRNYSPDNIINPECEASPTGVEWRMDSIYSNEHNLSPYQSVVVGDIDGDGIVEIIAAADPVNTSEREASQIVIYKGNDIKAPPTVINITKKFNCDFRVKYGLVKTKIAGKDSTLIVVAEYDTIMRAYNDNGIQVWESVAKYAATNNGASPTFADFNHDGVPEIAIGGNLFNSTDGALICSIPAGCPFINDPHSITVQAVDALDNGELKYVMGNYIYTVNINSVTNAIESLTLNKAITPPAGCPAGGKSLFVDMDRDGSLEMIVAHAYPSKVTLYVADPSSAGFKASVTIPADSCGYPIVGDVDGDRNNEIILITGKNDHTNNYIICYKYIPGNTDLQEFWKLSHQDDSDITGMTLFDFDQDGKVEIVYRDEQNLRIIDGQVTSAYPDRNKAFSPNLSGTGAEYPVVADVDGDSQAEIIIVGGLASDTDPDYKGRLWIYKSPDPVDSPWAPARKVWNQYAYHPLYVNEDLSIPQNSWNPAISLPGANGTGGGGDDVQPYNNYLQQQTMLNINGLPVWLAANAEFTGEPVFKYYADGDSLVITVQVKNIGEVGLQAPVYLTAYKDAVDVANKMAVDSCMTNINAGATKPVSVTIRNLASFGAFGKIVVRLNNKGGATYVQTECDYDNNDHEYNENEILRAHNDRAATLLTMPIKVDVLANDSIPDGCTPTPELIEPFAKHGAATVVNDSVQYTAAAGFVGFDTVTYRIACGEDVSTAYVYITVYSKPDNIVDESYCALPMPTITFEIAEMWNAPGGDGFANSNVLVGDLDGDGIAEIISYKNIDGYMSVIPEVERYQLQGIRVHDGSNGAEKAFINFKTYDGTHYPYGTDGGYPHMGAVLVDADRNGFGEIIVPLGDRTLMSYEADTAGGFHLTEKWAASPSYELPTGSEPCELPTLNVADFNGDGVPELLVYNKIYNAVTGAYLGETEPVGSAFFGRLPLALYNRATNLQATADIDGDGLPEIVAGGKVYKVSFNAAKTATTCTIIANNPNVADGYTVVADIDMDGRLDAIVTNTIPADSKGFLHVWSPVDDRLIKLEVESNLHRYKLISPPFVGDIDGTIDALTGKKYPEICINIAREPNLYSVRSYKYVPSTHKLDEKWSFPTTDQSGATPLSLFDFDNDGVNELVYRDETDLYILNGSADNTPPTLLTNKIPCVSGTAIEYPVIADIDGDGSANICVTCSYTGWAWTDPRIYVFESGTPEPWAPARKVWNQVNYEPTQINEDLTVPVFPVPKNREFSGKHPYNGALLQTPIVNDQFEPVLNASDATVTEMWVEEINSVTLRVWAKIKNQGVTNTNLLMPVTLYHTATTSGNKIETTTIGSIIVPADSTNIYWDVDISTNVYTSFIARIQDDGTVFPNTSYIDCNSNNNTGVLSSFVFANDDYKATIIATPVIIDVMKNDFIPDDCTPTLSILTPVTLHGAATEVNDNNIEYTPNPDFYGVDSLVYRLTCDKNTTEAKVYIVINKPIAADNTYIGCYGENVTAGFEHIDNVEYLWYDVETGGSPDGGGARDTRDCPAPSEWWVEAQYKGQPVAPRFKVTVDAYPALTPGSIKADDTICYNHVPEPFENVSSADGGNGIPEYKWQYSEDNGAQWNYIAGETFDTYAPTNTLTQTTWYRREASNKCGTVHTDSVKITVYPQSLGNYPDLRIRVCPDAGTIIDLSKYIDTFAVVESILWKSVSPPLTITNGTISADNLNEYTNVYTLTYTIKNHCLSHVERKVYLERLKNGRMRPLRDAVVVCYKLAERLQLNQIFGVDAAGTWSFDPDVVDVPPYITRWPNGAVIMNGKEIYGNSTGNVEVKVTYKPGDNSCLQGKEYTITIILTPDIIEN